MVPLATRCMQLLWKRARMAQSLDMNCIAEGVESPADGVFAPKVGCNDVQGWAIARPLPATAISTWLERWPADYYTLIRTTGMRA